MIRDLIYHCCPLRTNDLWRDNLAQLRHRIDIFNGHRIIAVSVGDGDRLHPVSEVVREMSGTECRTIMVRNDRNLREVASFRPLLDEVYSMDPRRCVFYAHTKGNSTYGDVQGSIYWRNSMYFFLLDQWRERMDDLFKGGHAAVGTHMIRWKEGMRSPYPSRLQHGLWMFAGTFFWFRSLRVFGIDNPLPDKSWKVVPRDRYGAESWLSGLFSAEQVKSCFQPWRGAGFGIDPYDPQLYIDRGVAIPDCELENPAYCI